MAELAAILDAIAWPIFLAFVLWRFHEKVRGIADAIVQRLHRGEAFEVAGLKMAGLPQTPAEQREAVTADAVPPTDLGPTANNHEASNKSVASYLLAEDLVLRKIQATEGVLVNRSVKQAGFAIDGFYVQNGSPVLVEVKKFTGRRTKSAILQYAKIISNKLKSLNWSSASVLFVVVFDEKVDDEWILQLQRELDEANFSPNYDLRVRAETLKELLAEYGGVFS